MVDFERLFELLEKADYAADCDCSVTTRAYLKLAQCEALDQADRMETDDGRRRLLRAAQYVERKTRGMAKFQDAAHYAWTFWQGFENGWKEHGIPGHPNEAFKMGRRLATAST